jgi:hypothetical protein
MRRHIRGPAWLLATAIPLAALVHVHCAHADASVSGEPDAVRVEVNNAPIDEVMLALGVSFGLQYHSPAALSRRVSGMYEGSLQRVVARLLDGYDFVIRTGPKGVEVRVYGAVKTGEAVLAPKPVVVPKPPPSAKTRRDARRKRHAL